jgi:1,4-alpha-glucan branching enzyme
MRGIISQQQQQQRAAATATTIGSFRKSSFGGRSASKKCNNNALKVVFCGGSGARARRDERRARCSKHHRVETSSSFGSNATRKKKEGETLTRAMREVHDTKDEQKTEETKAYSKDGTDLIEIDEMLKPHEGHLRYRWEKFLEVKGAIEKASGSLSAFADGYKEYGFSKKEDGTIVYKEWMPACNHAALVGDFNGWNGEATPMARDDFGNWSCELPAGTIPHDSRVKIRFFKDDGHVDRIPAYIRYARVPPNEMGAKYDGIYWDPPKEERHEWKFKKGPKKPSAPRIYEAHVGMSSNDPKVSTYREFADTVLPRIKGGGYNSVQLMAVMEHAYYGSFGYHVTNFFGVSSRSGTPEDFKYLVDKAHELGLRVIIDVIHSHASKNTEDGLAGFDVGQKAEDSYFDVGEKGYHYLWDSRLFKYDNWETQRLLLSNAKYWIDEYGVDGYRFDGVTSMLYHHHGLNMEFTGNYEEYLGMNTNIDAVVYLMLVNDMLHSNYPEVEVFAEDVSGMPTLCRDVRENGVGFDARLAMSIPDFWVKYFKTRKDEDWGMHEIISTLCNRRYSEKAIAYVESHDQSIVGDKTTAFWLMDAEMYGHMSATQPITPIIERGIALHKMLRLITIGLGGEGYLAFMGNEFGHPEWVDFPREGNNWSHDHCRRRWDLADAEHLRYKDMKNFDREMLNIEDGFKFLSNGHQHVSTADDNRKIIVFERGDLLFVFNFNPTQDFEGLEIGVPKPGKYVCVLDTDEGQFGGRNRVDKGTEHFTSPEKIESWVGPYPQEPRECSMKVLSCSRTAQVYRRVDESEFMNSHPDAAAVAR